MSERYYMYQCVTYILVQDTRYFVINCGQHFYKFKQNGYYDLIIYIY